MSVFAYVRMCVCVYVCMFVENFVFMYVYVNESICERVCSYVCKCDIFVSEYMFMFVSIYKCNSKWFYLYELL